MTEPWLLGADTVVHLGISEYISHTRIAEKSVPAHKIGRLWKFQATEVDSWVRGGGAAASGVPPSSELLTLMHLRIQCRRLHIS